MRLITVSWLLALLASPAFAANQTIPNLPAATGMTGSELLWGVQNGVDVRFTSGQIASLAVGGGGIPTIPLTGLLYGNGANPVTALTLGGDCTMNYVTGAVTCLKTNGTAFGALATLAPGTGVATALGNTSAGANGVAVLNGSGILPVAQGGTGGLLPIANGGTGTASPSIVAGTGITLSGSWPNQTVNATSVVNSGSTNNVAYYAGSGTAVSGETLSALLDASLGSTQGSVIYRGASTWTVLAPGTSGYFLQTQGSSANPTWASASGSSGCTTGGSSGNMLVASGTGTCITDTNASLVNGAMTLGSSGTAGSVTMGNATSGTLALQPVTGALGSVTVSIPAATDTLVNLAGTQTLTNKSISGASNTLSNIPLSANSTQSANTMVANVTGSSAAPTAVSLPSCSGANQALNYTSGTGPGCATITSTSAVTLIATSSASAAATLTFSGLNTTYYSYKLTCIMSASSSANFELRFGNGSLFTSNYQYAGFYNNGLANVTPLQNTSAAFILLTGHPTTLVSFTLDLINITGDLTASGVYPAALGQVLDQAGFTATSIQGQYHGATSAAAGVTQVQLLTSAGTMTGECSLYGITQ